MKHPIATLVAAAALALGAATAADAQQYASTSKDVNLRAGPGRTYPVVAVLPPQMQVLVYGCIPSYTWCDVAAGPDRGWVYAGNLLYDYDNRVVILPSVAAVIGIGIATFIIDDYWRDHYIDRPWWPQRQRWYRPPPRPPVREHAPGYRPPPPRPHPGPVAPHVPRGPQDGRPMPPPPAQRVQPPPRPPQAQPAPQQQRPARPERREQREDRDRR
jgi:uncharacterized protein YraI